MGIRGIGLAFIVVGVILLVFGFNATEAPVERASEALTGRFTDKTMLYLILGAVAVIVGGGMALIRRGT